MIRAVAAVLAGLVAAFAAIMLVETVGHTILPPPEGLDPMTPGGMSAIVERMSPAALLFILLAYAAGGVAGGAVAARVGGAARLAEAVTVGVLLTVLTLLYVITIAHPLWMSVASVVIPVPAAWLGARLVVRRSP